MMRIRKEKNQQIQDPGFGAKFYRPTKQLINKDGSFNVTRRGVSWMVNLYQHLIHMKWYPFLLLVMFLFVSTNCLYAGLYFVIGVEQLSGIHGEHPLFLQLFFFSTQTFTTVGYGLISPVGLGANVLASFESLNGLLFFALATGLLYGRFSRPNAKLRFSKQMVMRPYKEGKALMFRVANTRKTQLMEMHARLMLSVLEKEGDTYQRRYYDLKLERKSVLFFPLSWTIVHYIDEESPLNRLGEQHLEKCSTEFLILMTGFDDTFSQTVHTRYSYSYKEISFNSKFERDFTTNEDGVLELDLDRIHHVEEL